MLLRLLLDDDASSSTRCTGKRAVETAQTKIMDRGLCPAGGGKYGPQTRAGVVLSHSTSVAPRRCERRYGAARLAAMATAASSYGAKGRAQRRDDMGDPCEYCAYLV